LDPNHRRTVGSARGIVSRDLVRKGSRVWSRGSRGCERQYPDSWRAVGATAEREWNLGGMKSSGFRRENSQNIGIRIRESRSAENRVHVDVWQKTRWDPRGRRVDTCCLEVEVNILLNSRISGIHGIGG
jgi:hypothetical protein